MIVEQHIRGEVGRSGSSCRSIGAEPGLPDCTFVADKGTDPVTGLAVAEHRVAIYSTFQHMLDK